MTNEDIKEGEVLSSGQSPKESKIVEHVEGGDMTKMTYLDRLRLSNDLSKITRTQVADVTRTMVEAQKQEMITRLTFDLDINKKRAFNQYMDNVDSLNNELLDKSNKMTKDLRETTGDALLALYDERDEMIAKIDARKLSDEDHKKEIDRMKRWLETAENEIEGKMELLKETHLKSLFETLKLFKDNALKESDIKGKTVLD